MTVVSEAIGRAFDTEGAAIYDVQVDLRGADVLVAEQILNGTNVGSVFQEMAVHVPPVDELIRRS